MPEKSRFDFEDQKPSEREEIRIPDKQPELAVRLASLREGLQRFKAERAEDERAGASHEGVSTESLQERRRAERQKVAERVIRRIELEGFRVETLKEALRNIEDLSLEDCNAILELIPYLLIEWDPALKQFLLNLRKALRAKVRLLKKKQ